MTDNQFLLKSSLQLFADGDDTVDNPIDNPIDDNPNDDLSGEDELFKALQSLRDSDDDSDDSDDDTTDDDADDNEDDTEDDVDDTDTDDVDDTPVDTDTDKKKQSKEDNAKFAAERRQKELDARVQAEVERLKQQSPDFLLSKQLSEMYGIPPEQIIEQMREAALQKEAQERKIPVEELREKQQMKDKTTQLETELNQLRFENWKNRVEVEKTNLQSQYKMLTTEDMDKVVDYVLTVARNVNMPLEDALYAVHGKKIIDALSKDKVQDELAAQSGRKKKTPLAPNNGKASQAKSLSADEQYIAKQFGMSADDYLKYKS